MVEPHVHKFDQRVKRKVPISHYGATLENLTPHGTLVGHDFLLLWKCTCGKAEAYDLVREIG